MSNISLQRIIPRIINLSANNKLTDPEIHTRNINRCGVNTFFQVLASGPHQLASMGKGDGEVPYNIYGTKKGGYAIMHIVKGDKNHFFMSKKIPELIEAAEDESKLAEIAAAIN